MHMEARGYSVISQEPLALFVETGSPEPRCLARLIDQEDLGPCLSLHPRAGVTEAHSHTAFPWVQALNSASHVYVASTLHGSACFPSPESDVSVYWVPDGKGQQFLGDVERTYGHLSLLA